MKTTLLALALALTGLELWAQAPSALPSVAQRRAQLLGNTNSQGTLPRYQSPAPGAVDAQGANAAAAGGGAQVAPGGNGAPGGGAGAPGFLPQAAPPAPAAGADAAPPEEILPAGAIDFEGVELNQVLLIYAKLVNRTLRPCINRDISLILFM